MAVFSLSTRIPPIERVGMGFGIISTCLSLGIMIGPCLVGIARDLVGGYGAGFLMMALFAFLSTASIVPLEMNNNLTKGTDAGDAERR